MTLTQEQIEQLKQIKTPWGEIGYITFKRTYARRLKEDKPNSPTEEYIDTVLRVIKACQKQLKVGFTNEEEYRLAEILLNLKGTVAGRFLWQLGTKTVDKLGLPSLQNCAVCVVNESIRPFTWTAEMLMLGCGVGYNIQKEYVYQIPPLRKEKITIERWDDKSADYIVPDTREGWVKLLGKVLKAHFYTGKGFTYSCQLVRSEGEPIKSFGGTSSGPGILADGIDKINNVLNSRVGKKLRPIDCLDIMNIIAQIVVSGNVRRSAELAIGDWDDLEYLKAKRWDLGPIPNWRSNSNNSVVSPQNLNDLPSEFWDTYEQGEPYGLINLDLSRKCGRLGETQYPDLNIVCYNPCAEQSLENFETCCLADIFLPNITSKEELFEVARYLYRINKHSLAIPCTIQETEEVVHRNMRMGIGITGVLQSSEEQKSWLSDCYVYLREYDEQYSKEHNWPVSIKLTTSKPSGCLVESTKIKTNKGLLTLTEIFELNGYSIDEMQDNLFVECFEEILVKDMFNEWQEIEMLYVNRDIDLIQIEFEDGLIVKCTPDHKFLSKTRGWIKCKDLNISDEIVSFND